jgi:TM2 domain-containing membrane protein YozV
MNQHKINSGAFSKSGFNPGNYNAVNPTQPQGMAANMVYPSNPPKNPILACVLSGLFYGIGQMYLGQVGKGITYLVCGIIATIGSFGFLWLPYGVICCIDAYKIGKKLQDGYPVGKWEYWLGRRKK